MEYFVQQSCYQTQTWVMILVEVVLYTYKKNEKLNALDLFEF